MVSRPSLASRIVLLGAFSAASVGWLGVDLAPSVRGGSPEAAVSVEVERESGAAAGSGWQPGVRDRSAWQPSPIPSTSSAAKGGSTQQGQPSAASARLPLAPAPSLSGPAPAGGTAPSFPGIGGLLELLPGFGRKAEAPQAEQDFETNEALELSEASYLPMATQLSSDYLESYFGAALPDRRGDWQHAEFFSQALGRDVTYVAWLPPGYDTATEAYPTLYLLHGVGGEEGFGVEEWLGYALTETMERMLALGLIEPMIVILPNGEQGYWMNHADGGPRWADFVAIDLVQHVDASLRTAPVRERRAIGGLSMGGHGALQLALNHPDTFSIAGAHSPTLRPFETSPEFFGDQRWFATYDPLSLVRSTPAAPRLATWIDVGHEDKWRRSAEVLRSAYEAKHAPLEFRTLEGEHEGWYWKYYLPEYLGFYSAALHATEWSPQGAPLVLEHSLLIANTLLPTP